LSFKVVVVAKATTIDEILALFRGRVVEVAEDGFLTLASPRGETWEQDYTRMTTNIPGLSAGSC